MWRLLVFFVVMDGPIVRKLCVGINGDRNIDP